MVRKRNVDTPSSPMGYEYVSAQGSQRRSFGRDYRFVAGLIILISLIAFFVFFEVAKMSSSDDSSQLAELPWWKTSVIYQIYPWSFQDSNGDGNGDLRGIASRVDYLSDLGIGAVWLTPIYPSPMVDFGYDITNFVDIDPTFGTLEDFDELLAKLKTRGIKVIMDFVPNHTSDQHPWFLKSVDRIDPYTDYYMWKDPKGYNAGLPIPPNNWNSIYGSAWEWNEKRQQFYFHNYEKAQPDLNVRNPAVMDELDNVIKFWLDRGVYGIRLDAISYLFEAEDVYQDKPINKEIAGKVDPSHRSYLSPVYTKNQPETLKAVRRWRKILDKYDDRMMVAEVSGTLAEYMEYYGSEEEPMADFPFNFFLIKRFKKPHLTGPRLKETIDDWLRFMEGGRWSNWVIGSHDEPRVDERVGREMLDAMNMVVLLLKGTPFTYYGEEIGMANTDVSFEDAKDPRGRHYGLEKYKKYGRDPSRTPMQWDDSVNAGFSSAKRTWLPVNENYKTLNVAAQRDACQSHLKVYRSLVRLRKERTFTHGEFHYGVVTEDVFSFIRQLKGENAYLVVVNLNDTQTLRLTEDFTKGVRGQPTGGTVVVRSSFDTRPETQPGMPAALDSLSVLPKEGIVISLSCTS